MLNLKKLMPTTEKNQNHNHSHRRLIGCRFAFINNVVSMSKRDYYDVLGVSKDADEKTLKAAYRKLAMANHPDRNQGNDDAEEQFQEAGEAYEILKILKNAPYDRMGHAAFDQTGGGFSGTGLAAIKVC